MTAHEITPTSVYAHPWTTHNFWWSEHGFYPLFHEEFYLRFTDRRTSSNLATRVRVYTREFLEHPEQLGHKSFLEHLVKSTGTTQDDLAAAKRVIVGQGVTYHPAQQLSIASAKEAISQYATKQLHLGFADVKIVSLDGIIIPRSESDDVEAIIEEAVRNPQFFSYKGSLEELTPRDYQHTLATWNENEARRKAFEQFKSRGGRVNVTLSAQIITQLFGHISDDLDHGYMDGGILHAKLKDGTDIVVHAPKPKRVK